MAKKKTSRSKSSSARRPAARSAKRTIKKAVRKAKAKRTVKKVVRSVKRAKKRTTAKRISGAVSKATRTAKKGASAAAKAARTAYQRTVESPTVAAVGEKARQVAERAVETVKSATHKVGEVISNSVDRPSRHEDELEAEEPRETSAAARSAARFEDEW